MFIVFQLPIIDCRAFLASSDGRLAKPTWPIPEPDKDFVRQFGAVHRRRRGGLHEFAGEDVFCRAYKAIRLKNETGILSAKDGAYSEHQRTIFRRFFFEGRCVGKMEIGFRRLNAPFSFRGHWNFLIGSIA